MYLFKEYKSVQGFKNTDFSLIVLCPGQDKNKF